MRAYGMRACAHARLSHAHVPMCTASSTSKSRCTCGHPAWDHATSPRPPEPDAGAPPGCFTQQTAATQAHNTGRFGETYPLRVALQARSPPPWPLRTNGVFLVSLTACQLAFLKFCKGPASPFTDFVAVPFLPPFFGASFGSVQKSLFQAFGSIFSSTWL